jgi:L,D-transpeptidase YbiS
MQTNRRKIEISIGDQILQLTESGRTLRQYAISSSRFGLGTREGSNKTPLGKFRIAEKIGQDQPIGTVFKARKPVRPNEALPETEDLITSRILWLNGVGKRNANTHARFIYIHGTRHEDTIGTPDSHGCIRMRNEDVMELFDLVSEGTAVTIRR